ncbi:MAG: hypothetical protein O3A30_03955 [Bacteroidetes bacterium]|nr:hypothetical protein [Bacteroidota bacterium]
MEETFFANSSNVQDYAQSVVDYHTAAGVDKRAIAVGEDGEFVTHDWLAAPVDSWAENLWAAASSVKVWEDVLKPISPDGSPVAASEILTYITTPLDDRTQSMADGDRNFTFINHSELFYLEEFYLNSDYVSKFGPLSYSAIDVEDILAGEKDGFFDIVRIHSAHVVRTDTKLLDKYMDAVKVGGVFLLNEVSGWTDLYKDSLKIHHSYYSDIGRHITSRSDFITHHVPLDMGMVVARRIS